MGSNVVTISRIMGSFTIAVTSTFQIQHTSDTTQAANGFGVGSFAGNSVFTQVKITKR
jgi:hypothetical protein